jgi:hypothetical protein
MFRQQLATSIAAIVILLAQVSWAAAADPPFEFSVKKHEFFGSSKGTLVFSQDGVEFQAADKKVARRWIYEDIKQVQILSPTRIAVLTYEDQGRLKLGADRTYRFEVTQDAVSPDLVTFLLERIPRPVVTAVVPRAGGEPLFRAHVKHLRQGRGSEGSLLMYEDRLVYLTEREDDARFWRFGDIFSVQRLDRFRLQVMAYEGGSGKTRPFVFELKSDLPEGFYDALWARVNPPALDLQGLDGQRLAGNLRE